VHVTAEQAVVESTSFSLGQQWGEDHYQLGQQNHYHQPVPVGLAVILAAYSLLLVVQRLPWD
jgi:hypothetical protein